MHPDFDQLVLRVETVSDETALKRLAVMDEKPLSDGLHVVAEIDGVVVAAKSVDGGELIADPFRRTAHLLPLLELRAGQLFPAGRGRRHPLRTALRAIHV
jgi:hypothetical protein